MLLVTEFTTERGETFTVLQLLKRLRNAIIQIDGILFEHQGRIETLEFDVEKIKNDIEFIIEQLLKVINRVVILEYKVEIVEETLVTIENQIQTINSQIQNIENNIANIENNIANIENIVNNHTERLDEFQLTISSINETVNSLITDINIINNKIDDLQNQVDNIPIVSASALNGYIKIDGVDTLVYQDDGSGTGGETFKSNKSLLTYKKFGENDYGVYKNVFNYLVGDEITKTIGNSVLRYNFRYPCYYAVKDETSPVANFQITIGGVNLNLGEITFTKDAANKNFNLECEIRITKNDSSDYNISALMKFYTADPELWINDTLIKTLYSSETGIVIVPQDSLKFNVMLQNSYLNIGWYQCNPSSFPVKSGSWRGVLETDLITNIVGSD